MPVVDGLTLAAGGNLTCLAPGWCDYESKTIHLDHVSKVSFTVSWDCVKLDPYNPGPGSQPERKVSIGLSVHTSTA